VFPVRRGALGRGSPGGARFRVGEGCGGRLAEWQAPKERERRGLGCGRGVNYKAVLARVEVEVDLLKLGCLRVRS
jgi:hypothetical protein